MNFTNEKYDNPELEEEFSKEAPNYDDVQS